MSLFTFSALRQSSEDTLLQQLALNVSDLAQRVSTGIVVRVAASRNGTGGGIMRALVDDLSSYASYPVRFVVEVSE